MTVLVAHILRHYLHFGPSSIRSLQCETTHFTPSHWPDLYRERGIDAEAILGAAAGACLERPVSSG
jgi:hypothetical protein